ncbi:MAG TPA: hypothetical protein VLH09_13305 [Bryobacteraceae bacterium]|nr:hypothetical protein [Bryobacteraceae bacterium]
MASLQRYSSHGQTCWRIVESFRRADGQPTVRVLMHLGKAEELLLRLQQHRAAVRLRSVSAGAVDAAFALAAQLHCSEIIDQAVAAAGGDVRHRDGLRVGQSLVAAAVVAAEQIPLQAIAYDTPNFFVGWTSTCAPPCATEALVCTAFLALTVRSSIACTSLPKAKWESRARGTREG